MRVVPGPDADLSPFPASAWPGHISSYPCDRATGKYFAHARLYDAETGRMLGRDPIRRGINAYPYCDNDPVNYTDPTGEIANILGGALTGGVVGGVFGFAGSAVSQVMSGNGVDMRRALGAGVNGAVVGAVRGAVIASGAGALAGAGADFAAGMIGSALEQYIAGDNVDFGRTVTSGLSNAASGLAYGTGRIGSAREAFKRGFKSGAARSGIEYLYETLGKPKKKNRRKKNNLRRRTRRTIAPQLYGISDPRRNCTVQKSSNQNQLPGSGIVNKGLYEAAEDKLRTTEGFNLLGFAKAVALGGVMEGLGSAAFYGVGKGLESLWRSVKGCNTPEVENGVLISSAETDSNFKQLNSELSLNNRQKRILELLDNPGDTALVRKKSVSMNDLRQLTNVTGDEFNMFTRGGRRLIIRGRGNRIRVSEEMYNDILNGLYGKFSGHTHPGYSLNPGPADEPFLKILGQKRSSIWGNTGEGWLPFGQGYWETQAVQAQIRHEKMMKIYGNL